MKNIAIISPSRRDLEAYLLANPWINAGAVTPVTAPEDLHGHGGLVLALPGWQWSPSIARPRAILDLISAHGMQLVVLEQAAYQLQPEPGQSVEQLVAAGDPLGAL